MIRNLYFRLAKIHQGLKGVVGFKKSYVIFGGGRAQYSFSLKRVDTWSGKAPNTLT